MHVSTLAEERGAVLVVVAAAMSAMVIIVALVLSTASWFERHRHLQLQADAGALAGAASFNSCVSASSADRANPGSIVNADIKTIAKRYAGDPAATTPYNKENSSDSSVSVFINSKNYGSGGADDTEVDPTPGGAPCRAGYVDVKATDTGLSWLFVAGPKRTINTHARVSILQISSLAGSLPLAVEDVNPLATGAVFVNEDSSPNAILARTPMTVGGVTTLNGMSLTPWTSGAVSVSVATAHTGVVIVLCSNKGLCKNPAITTWLTGPGTVAAICGQPLVTCYQSGGAAGLEMIRGYSDSGSGSASTPIVRSVTLLPGGCADDSSPYFLLNAGCSIGAQATVDFGVTGDPSRSAAQGGISAQVSVGNCNLNYVSSNGTNSTWNRASCQNIASGAGPVSLNLSWQTGSGSNKKSGTVTRVARPFANDGPLDDQSYPVAFAQIRQGGTCSGAAANSVPFGATSFCVGIGVLGNLKNASDVSDPTKVLKFIGGSHTGAIQCNGKTGADALRDGIATGCTTPVQLNSGELCPNATTPVDCLPVETGGKVGPTRQGMNDRFAPGDVCPPNNWVSAPGTLPTIPNGDRRVVPMIVTLFGGFAGSGSAYVPVTDFAVFYVTGWDGAPNSCAGINEPAPAGAGNGSIWGHFIKYTGDLGTSTGGGACDFDAFAPCITVMTR